MPPGSALDGLGADIAGMPKQLQESPPSATVRNRPGQCNEGTREELRSQSDAPAMCHVCGDEALHARPVDDLLAVSLRLH